MVESDVKPIIVRVLDINLDIEKLFQNFDVGLRAPGQGHSAELAWLTLSNDDMARSEERNQIRHVSPGRMQQKR